MTEEERQARYAFFVESVHPLLLPWVIPLGAMLLFFATVAIVVRARRCPKKVHLNRFAVFLIGAWTVLPPVWFLGEYFLIGRLYKDTLPSVEAFKYTQELAKNFWIAAVAVLVAVYKGKLPGSSDPT